METLWTVVNISHGLKTFGNKALEPLATSLGLDHGKAGSGGAAICFARGLSHAGGGFVGTDVVMIHGQS